MRDFNKHDWRPHAVVFDLDGLLINSEGLFRLAAAKVVASRGKEVLPTVLDAMMGTPAHRAIQLLRDHHQIDGTIDELILETTDVFYLELGDRRIDLMPGAERLLSTLAKSRRTMALATSSRRKYVARMLAPYDYERLFNEILTAEDVREGKPSPEIYEKTARRLSIAPENLLVLEDSPNGMRAALAAGCRCGVVPHEHVPREQISNATFVFESLNDARLWSILGIESEPDARRAS